MDKQGKGSSGATVVILILAVLITAIAVGVGWKYFTDDGASASIAPGMATTETGALVTSGMVSCPSDGTTDARVRYENTLAAVTTYTASPTVYFEALTTGLERVTAGSLSASDYSTSVDVKCTKAGTSWRPVGITTSDAFHSAVGDSFTAEGAYVKKDLLGKSFARLQFKVEDRFTGGSVFFNESTCAATATTSWAHFDGTQCIIKDQVGNTALKVDADEYIDARISIKTNATKNQFGEDGLKTWMLVDADASAWDEPIVSRDGGAKLIDSLASMQHEDRRKYSGYEYAYEIGSIGDRESVIDFYMETASGVDPGASNDPVIEICAEGRYNSNKQKDTVLTGCWNDAASQTEVATGARHYFKFEVTA